MMIPKHLRWYEKEYAGNPAALEAARKDAEAFVVETRDALKKEPRYNSAEEAKKNALALHIKAARANDNAGKLLSIWKEPEDVGTGYAIVSFENRENANNAGYTEVLTVNDIYDAVKAGSIDEIEEA